MHAEKKQNSCVTQLKQKKSQQDFSLHFELMQSMLRYNTFICLYACHTHRGDWLDTKSVRTRSVRQRCRRQDVSEGCGEQPVMWKMESVQTKENHHWNVISWRGVLKYIWCYCHGWHILKFIRLLLDWLGKKRRNTNIVMDYLFQVGAPTGRKLENSTLQFCNKKIWKDTENIDSHDNYFAKAPTKTMRVFLKTQ